MAHSIHRANMTAPPKRIRTKAGKERWKWLEQRTAEHLRERSVGDVRRGVPKQKLKPLIDRLLSIGGDFVLIPLREPDLEKLLKRGTLWEGPPTHSMSMSMSQCHANVAELYGNRQITAIATGYGLTHDPDGIRLWRQHSWGVLIGTDDVPEVVETTEPRKLYYGAILTPEEAEEFLQWNAPP